MSEYNSAEVQRVEEIYERRSRTAKPVYGYMYPANLFNIQERERRILGRINALYEGSLEHLRILEVGCGWGFWLRAFIAWGANPECVAGIDILPERVEKARKSLPSSVDVRCVPATRLPYPDSQFDLVFQSTVFSSIPDEHTRKSAAKEMLRVLKPDGVILWYDFLIGNPRNRDVRGIRMREINELFPRCVISSERLTLPPPLTRLLVPRARLLCSLIAWSNIASVCHLAVIRKAGDNSERYDHS